MSRTETAYENPKNGSRALLECHERSYLDEDGEQIIESAIYLTVWKNGEDDFNELQFLSDYLALMYLRENGYEEQVL